MSFTPAAYIQKHFGLDFFMVANNVDPDQEQSDLGPSCLQYWLQMRGQTTSRDWRAFLQIQITQTRQEGPVSLT